MTEVRPQSTQKKSRQHTTFQRSHITCTRKDITWEIHGDQSLIHYLDTHRRTSEVDRNTGVRKSLDLSSQSAKHRICWIGKVKVKAIKQDCGKSRGWPKDLNINS